MQVRRLPDDAISVTDAEHFEDFASELLTLFEAGGAEHVIYDGETVTIDAIEGTIRYRRIGEPDEMGLCRMERIA